MPSLAEILETLHWYRPLETILSDEGIIVAKISEAEIKISIGDITRIARLQLNENYGKIFLE